MLDAHGALSADGPCFGPVAAPTGGATFRLWAPAARTVSLILDRQPFAMERGDEGWFQLWQGEAAPGARYAFRIDDEIDVPDPASRFQPDDVHGPSELVAPAFSWTTPDWRGRPWRQAVFLELHVGTFTAEGTFRAAIEKLDHVVAAGFTAIELMPVADFPGRWNWGYDGVSWFAPDSAYGRPDDLRALVDAAHAHGLMVFLDVVYNHFGPEGNYIGRYAPQFFTEAQTPWGSAIDYTRPEVRRFAVENALYWLTDFRFDGLRLDAVHAMPEPGRSALLTELGHAVSELIAASGRHIHLVLENDDNQASLLDPRGGPFKAQWNDDFHHAFHVLATGEARGYYRDYRPDDVAPALARGFVYQGQPSAHRGGRPRGEATDALSPDAFVNFLQNHDQIGNRPFGDRLSVLAKPELVEAALVLMLLSPGVPLMFMGEEWGTQAPFPFFCDFQGELADAVREGRRREFADHYRDQQHAPPDALDAGTMQSARLEWRELSSPQAQARLSLVRRLLEVRRTSIVPLLPRLSRGHAASSYQDGLLHVAWRFDTDGEYSMRANLAPAPRDCRSPLDGASVWGDAALAVLPPWSVQAALRSG